MKMKLWGLQRWILTFNLPRKVLQIYSDIWLPDLDDSEKCDSSLFNIRLNCNQKNAVIFSQLSFSSNNCSVQYLLHYLYRYFIKFFIDLLIQNRQKFSRLNRIQRNVKFMIKGTFEIQDDSHKLKIHSDFETTCVKERIVPRFPLKSS